MTWPKTGEPSTAKDLAVYIDQDVLLDIETIQVWVRIMDVRSSFGNIQFLVTPLEGIGQQWVSAARCRGYEPEMRSL